MVNITMHLLRILSMTATYFAVTIHLSSICTAQIGTTSNTSTTNDTDNGTISLYLAAFFPFGGGWDGSGVIPAVEMALDHINVRQDMLPGYNIKMVWKDTQCEAGLGTRQLFDQIYSEPQKLMILGGGCSTATQAIAATAYHWNLVTMSYAASSSALSNRKVYPYFYRTYMPDAMYNPARIHIMKKYGWNRVATIHENHELFSLAIDDLLNLLTEENITVISSQSFAENPKNQIKNLKDQDAKIIVGNMYETKARRVFCEAYKQGITGEGYVWMMIGWYNDKWWEQDDDSIDCTPDEMREAVRGYIAVESLQLGQPDVITVANITSSDYVTLLRDRLQWPRNMDYGWNTLAPYGYDAAWAIALMLNETIYMLKTKHFSDNQTRRLEDFNYTDSEMAQLFFDNLRKTQFIGVTGPVSFKNGDRVGITQVEQLRVYCDDEWYLHGNHCYRFNQTAASWSEALVSCMTIDAYLAPINNETVTFIRDINDGNSNLQFSQTWTNDTDGCGDPIRMGDQYCPMISFTTYTGCKPSLCSTRMRYICRKLADQREEQVGLYDELSDELTWIDPTSETFWPDNNIPIDHTPVLKITVTMVNIGVSPFLFYTMMSIAVIGIIIALGFLSFNMIYRHQKLVKLSSPYLNNVIIIGGILIYLWVILYGLSSDVISESTLQKVCQIRHWFLSVGFVLSFGAIFCKTWRVYRVAMFKMPQRRIVSDTHLIVIVMALLCFDVILLMVWQFVDHMMVDETLLHQQDDPHTSNQKLQNYFNFCNCTYYSYWLGFIGGYKGLLLIFGTFLAWETRKVTIAELNDSKLIGSSVYNVVILCAIGVAVSATITDRPSILYIFLSSIVLFCTTITLVVIFVPKIISVIKYPTGIPINRVSGIATGLTSQSCTQVDNRQRPSSDRQSSEV